MPGRTQPREVTADGGTKGDVLSDVLRTVRLTGALFFPMEASSPWADEVPAATVLAPAILPGAQHVLSYHIVTRGECWATVAGCPPVSLKAGDVLLVPRGDPYVMSSAAGMRPDASADAVVSFFREMAAGSAPSLVTEGGGGPVRADLVCGFLTCDLHPFNPVIEALPRVIHLPRPVAASGHLTALIEFALAESRQGRPGAKCVLLRVSEVLFVEVVRRHLDGLAGEQTGWLAGLRDPTVGHALALLHERPAEAWTLMQLAREVGVSRSALIDRFTRLVGEPPMRYLTHWRLQVAARLLSDGALKVAAVARQVGYDSEAAFSRAFKKFAGASPAAWRRRRRH
jgi:AraC-like DNA-binding protein